MKSLFSFIVAILPLFAMAQTQSKIEVVTSDTAETRIFEQVDEQAEFPGGTPELFKYLANNIHYPEDAVKNNIDGKVYVSFIVTSAGKIEKVAILRNMVNCSACDQEAIRVIKNMPRWKPAKVNGKPVSSKYHLPISFKLN
jgi:protein TonB